MDLGLKGKAALVTGGSKGIGLATAIRLAKEGASVAICARDEAHLKAAAARIAAEADGAEALYVVADVTKQADCERAVAETVARFGRLDALVNNAGTAAANRIEQVSPEAWQQDLDLKLFGAIHCSQAAIPHLRAAGGGSIVNVTAIGGKTPGASSLPTSVSRAAGLALTKAMSRDLGPDGIRVNAVCIGLIRSDQIEKAWRRSAPESTWEQFSADPKHEVPLGRIGEAEEAANVIAFLSSPAASYVTGTAVNIDGGKGAAL
ncbi:SDR family NAD(P)-dependent oxidoreductase [Paenibacillus sp.]|uniref:SDR family NAD(P)-dependent oxidoreductase n=1 Tax=Paenibacillus sp. TaxID=58172 RepID=UPI002D3DD170|nr:SDR family NAD(P)-dependent oxidoreductase [Paenibacillus sp.]HZG56004.1 SDR family NAD(P)-dependent oxidoreductase [Paenibacillus sp.]